METTQQSRTTVTSGLLSKGEREFFQGEKDDVKDPDGYQRNARYRARQRMDQIEADLELLRESGQEDLVNEFINRFGKVERLQRQVEELESKLDDH